MKLPGKTGRARAARGMARATTLALVVVLVALAWVILVRVRTQATLQETTATQTRISVATTKPRPPADAALLTLPASVQANLEAPIFARTSGYLKRWLVDIGAAVQRGQRLDIPRRIWGTDTTHAKKPCQGGARSRKSSSCFLLVLSSDTTKRGLGTPILKPLRVSTTVPTYATDRGEARSILTACDLRAGLELA